MDIKLRNLRKTDRLRIDFLLSRINCFGNSDRVTAMEVVNIFLDHPEQKDYRFIVASNENDVVIGYACYGAAPLTDRTYELYWIAVDPDYSGKGVGTLLLKRIENAINDENGRMITLDTSSSQKYSPSRQFYIKNGYVSVGIIKDYYCKDEDKVIFLKKIHDN